MSPVEVEIPGEPQIPVEEPTYVEFSLADLAEYRDLPDPVLPMVDFSTISDPELFERAFYVAGKELDHPNFILDFERLESYVDDLMQASKLTTGVPYIDELFEKYLYWNVIGKKGALAFFVIDNALRQLSSENVAPERKAAISQELDVLSNETLSHADFAGDTRDIGKFAGLMAVLSGKHGD